MIRFAWISRGRIFGRAGPLLYPMLFELVAYSVTVGNAGTGFRYRSHLVTLGICITCVLWAAARERREVDDDESATPGLQHLPLRSFQPINA
jgi:hypothetical protein